MADDDHYALAPPPAWTATPRLTVAGSRRAFDHVRSFTIGVEEELLLVDPETLELAPVVDRVLAELAGDARFARELRPTQLETVSGICETAPEAAAELAAARRDLLDALDGRWRLLACGTHPFSRAWGEITDGDRYRQIADEYTWAAQRSLACGLHVHVAIDGAERALAVYNALRSFLPELAAISANSAFFEGADTGMSSIRPKLNEAFPRSGIPPRFADWDELVAFVDWGRRGGLFPDPTHFWWEMRPHPVHGTIEIRVADTQTTVDDAAAIVAVIQALVAWLTERHDAGDPLPDHPTYLITENSWRAHRYGVRGSLVDLDTGDPEPARERLERLIGTLEPYAAELGAADHLQAARPLLAGNGSDRQRYVFGRDGVVGLTRWLVEETERSALD